MVVKGELHDCVGYAAVVDVALDEIESRTFIVKELAHIILHFGVYFLNQFVNGDLLGLLEP